MDKWYRPSFYLHFPSCKVNTVVRAHFIESNERQHDENEKERNLSQQFDARTDSDYKTR